jgi:hypothetical protein
VTPAERISAYERATGWTHSLWLHVPSNCILGHWVLGNDYRVKSGFYGGYPATYLKRIKALFPDKPTALHLFSGKVDLETFPGTTVDMDFDNNPDYYDDAQTLLKVPLQDFNLCLADPPYSVEDAEHYGPPMVKRDRVMKALSRLPGGAHVVWLDQSLPMYRKDTWKIVGRIGVTRSTMHRFRVVTIFERRHGAAGAEGL